MGDMPLSLDCTQCNKRTVKMVSQFETQNAFVCPFCGHCHNLRAEPWVSMIRAARKAADEFDAKPGA
jgi:transcription elongation factor Elf1